MNKEECIFLKILAYGTIGFVVDFLEDKDGAVHTANTKDGVQHRVQTHLSQVCSFDFYRI